jgi:hypothetical protein
VVPLDALFTHSRNTIASPLAEQLGCAFDEGPFGPVIRTDAKRETTVPGVYAAGDAARVPHNATWASADGVTAGIAAHQSLALGERPPGRGVTMRAGVPVGAGRAVPLALRRYPTWCGRSVRSRRSAGRHAAALARRLLWLRIPAGPVRFDGVRYVGPHRDGAGHLWVTVDRRAATGGRAGETGGSSAARGPPGRRAPRPVTAGRRADANGILPAPARRPHLQACRTHPCARRR